MDKNQEKSNKTTKNREKSAKSRQSSSSNKFRFKVKNLIQGTK